MAKNKSTTGARKKAKKSFKKRKLIPPFIILVEDGCDREYRLCDSEQDLGQELQDILECGTCEDNIRIRELGQEVNFDYQSYEETHYDINFSK